MTAQKLYRLAGFALLIGALLDFVGIGLGNISFPGSTLPTQSNSSQFVLYQILSIAGSFLLVSGVPGVIVAQKESVLGVLGGVLLALGGYLFSGLSVIGVLVIPLLAQTFPALLTDGPPNIFLYILYASIALGIGGVLLAIAILKLHIFPKQVGWMLIGGVLLNLITVVPLPTTINVVISLLANVLLFGALGWLGYLLINFKPATKNTQRTKA